MHSRVFTSQEDGDAWPSTSSLKRHDRTPRSASSSSIERTLRAMEASKLSLDGVHSKEDVSWEQWCHPGSSGELCLSSARSPDLSPRRLSLSSLTGGAFHWDTHGDSQRSNHGASPYSDAAVSSQRVAEVGHSNMLLSPCTPPEHVSRLPARDGNEKSRVLLNRTYNTDAEHFSHATASRREQTPPPRLPSHGYGGYLSHDLQRDDQELRRRSTSSGLEPCATTPDMKQKGIWTFYGTSVPHQTMQEELPVPLPAPSFTEQEPAKPNPPPVLEEAEMKEDPLPQQSLGSCCLWALFCLALFLMMVGFQVLFSGSSLRQERIATFREYMRLAATETQQLPLPKQEHLRDERPQFLTADWATGSDSVQMNMSLVEVPLSQAVINDQFHADDGQKNKKLLNGLLEIEGGCTAGSTKCTKDMTVTSSFYRALVHRNMLPYHGPDVPIELKVFLPNGDTVLQHTFPPVKWLPAPEQDGSQWTRSKCEEVFGTFDATKSRCLTRHGVARLCYAVPPGSGPWQGALVSGCEYKTRSPVYVMVAMDKDPAKDAVEILLHNEKDPHIKLSEVTKGCTNCLGRPLGASGPLGTNSLACGGSPDVQVTSSLTRLGLANSPSRCFGQPDRREKVEGLIMLALATSLFSFYVLIWEIRLKIQRRPSKKLFAMSRTSSGALEWLGFIAIILWIYTLAVHWQILR